MNQVYAILWAAMGEEGALYICCDDLYLIAEPVNMAEVLAQAPALFGKVRLRIGLGPRKTELVLIPHGYEKSSFPYPLDDPGVVDPHVVLAGFYACLGVPRHFSNDQDFINNFL